MLEKSSLTFVHLNCNNIVSKEATLLKFRKKHGVDIMFLSETWLNSSKKHAIPKNEIFFDLQNPKPTYGRIEGGLMGICRIELKEHIRLLDKSIRNDWIILQVEDVILGYCYFNPNCPLENH